MFAITGQFVAATIERILDAEAAADDDSRRQCLALSNMLQTHVATADIAAGIRRAETALSTLAAEEEVITRTKCYDALGGLFGMVQDFARCAENLCRHDLLTTVYKSTLYAGETVLDDRRVETEAGQVNMAPFIAPTLIDDPEEHLDFGIRFPTEYVVLPEKTTLGPRPADMDPLPSEEALNDALLIPIIQLNESLVDPSDRPALIAALTDAEQAARTVDAARKKLETGMLDRYVLAELFPC